MQITVLHQMKQYEDILGCFEQQKKIVLEIYEEGFFQFWEIVELGTCTMYTYSKYEYLHMYTVIDI